MYDTEEIVFEKNALRKVEELVLNNIPLKTLVCEEGALEHSVLEVLSMSY